MALKVLGYRAIQRLYELFGISPGGAPGAVRLSTEIQPVVRVDELLATPIIYSATVTATASKDGATLAFTVPDGKQWEVMVIDFSRDSGDNEVRACVVQDDSAGPGLALGRQAGAADFQFVAPSRIMLDQKDRLNLDTDGTGVASTPFSARAWVLERDAY